MLDTLNISSKLHDYAVNFIDDLKKELQEFCASSTYVIDEKVYSLYQNDFQELEQDRIYLATATEERKNMDTVMDIISFWQKIGVKKEWKIVCIGGGIIQDVTTIASNIYLRNMEWYFFPTTLLAMCDSCIGGKCGINIGAYKNQIGVFYPPKKIFIDIKFLNTLSEEDYINGWGELLKFSLTEDASFYKELKKEPDYISCKKIDYYIHRGLMVKKKIIEADEFESDLRRILNYGHTFGHALEAYTRNRIPHGKAVIWGIDVVNYIAWHEGLIGRGIFEDIHSMIRKVFLKKKIEIDDPEQLFECVKMDKKVRGDAVNLVMPDSISHLVIRQIRIDTKLKNIFLEYIEEIDGYNND